MTVTASGPITFSNIMNEFNSSGGQSNIRLGDYLGRYPDNPTGGGTYAPTYGQRDIVFISWTGQHFTINSAAPTFNPGFFARAASNVIIFALDNTVNVPVYIASDQNTTGSNLISNVVNNGGQYSAGGTYQTGNYTYIYLNQTMSTATGGNTTTGNIFTTNSAIHINKNQQQTNGGSDVGIALAAVSNSPQYVTYNRPFFDVNYSASFLGGNEDAKASGTYNYDFTSQWPGILKSGDNILIRCTVSALHDGRSTGTPLTIYSPYMYPLTWNDNSNKTFARGFTLGNAGYLGWDTYGGSGTNYINGAGQHANNGTGVANCVRGGPANPTNAFGTLSTSGWSTSWGGSGSTLQLSLTNNTGTDYRVLRSNFNSNGGAYDLYTGQYLNSSSSTVLTNNAPSQWSSSPNGEHYGQNHYGSITVERRRSDDVSAGNIFFSQYSAGGIDEGSAIDGVMHNINNRKKDGATWYAGPGPAGATGTAGAYAENFFEAWKVNSTTVRVRYVSGIGGGFTSNTGGTAVYRNIDTTDGWPSALGGSNDIATISYSTPAYNLADNAAVNQNKRNIKLSHYYGTQNLGTDGG